MQKTTFNIPKMDCPSKERMIRMKLEGLTTIQTLQFDLSGRMLEIRHTGRYDNLLAALESLKLDAKVVSKSSEAEREQMKPPDRNERVCVEFPTPVPIQMKYLGLKYPSQ